MTLTPRAQGSAATAQSLRQQREYSQTAWLVLSTGTRGFCERWIAGGSLPRVWSPGRALDQPLNKGHKDLKMTLRYAHLAPDYKRAAIDRLGTYMDTRRFTREDDQALNP